jgi:hypothetical protein
MANSSSLLKYSLKTNIVKSIFTEIVSKTSRYYYTFGRTTPWPTVTAIDETTEESYIVSDEDIPPAALEAYSYEIQVRKDISYMKYLDANDAAIVIVRVNWQQGRVYDMYDEYSETRISYNGASSIDTATFYVLTDEFNVYKCLNNSNNSISFVKPTGVSSEAFMTSDGYMWKFMYTIPISLRNKFLTTGYMPVVTALNNQFYSNGAIVDYSIENPGAKYIKNTWSVERFRIISPGTNYTVENTTIVFPPPQLEGGVTAEAELVEVSSNGGIITIEITEPGSGYTVQPVPTITSATGGFVNFVVEYNKTSDGYTELKVYGDGYNEINPYSLKKVNIINRGVFTELPTGDLFTFTPPKNAYGYRPEVNVTFREIDGSSPIQYEVDTAIVTDQGYAYTERLVFGRNVFAQVLTSNGFSCNLDENSQKNDAVIIPFVNEEGEISGIQITEPGVGYNYATVEVIGKKLIEPGVPESAVDLSDTIIDPGYEEGFIKASVKLSFGVGDIDSKQSNVELQAIDGAIPVVKVDFSGNGYPSDTVLTVIGDGNGCVLEPVIQSGRIVRVNVMNPGSGYTTATVVTTPTLPENSPSKAILRTIVSPRGGHGKDAVSELYAKTIMLVTKLQREENQGVLVENDFRQITILKNPKEFEVDTTFKKTIGSTAALFVADITDQNTITYAQIEKDDTIEYSNGKTFTVIDKAIISNKYNIVVQINDNFVPAGGSTLSLAKNNVNYAMNLSSVTKPNVNKYSGEILYIDNRVKFAPSESQTIVASTLITF